MSYDQLMGHAYAIQIAASFWADDKDAVDGVADLFQPFTEIPDPRAFDRQIDSLTATLGLLCTGQMDTKDPIDGDAYLANPNLDRLPGVESYLERWTGSAAMAFKRNFIDPFPSQVRNQFVLAAVLKGAVEAERELWTRARDDIDTIAHKTIEALERMQHCGNNPWNMVFTVVGAVASIFAVPLTGGSSIELAVTAVEQASSILASKVDTPPATEYSGETAEAVINDLRDAVMEFVSHIEDAEAKIADAVSGMCATVDAHRGEFVAKRPTLAYSTAANVTDDAHMGRAR